MSASVIAPSNSRGRSVADDVNSCFHRSDDGALPTRVAATPAAPPNETENDSAVLGQSTQSGNSERFTFVVAPSSVQRRGETKTDTRSFPLGATPFGRAVMLIVCFFISL